MGRAHALMKHFGLYIFLFCSISYSFAQQDPQYSQYMFNQVVINPAYIGSKDALNVTGLFRKEWVNVNGSPQTNNLSLSGPLKAKKIGIGAHVVQETIGPKKWMSAYLDYCYRVKLGKGKLSFGLSTGLVSYNFNSSKLDLSDQNEPTLYTNSINRSIRFDMSAGLYYYSRTFFAGLSVTHLIHPTLFTTTSSQGQSISFYNLNQHLFFTVGKAFSINEQLVFSPSVLIKSIEGKTINADINANFLIRNKLWLGVSCRTSLSIVCLAQYLVTDKLKIGYSYDYGLNGIAKTSYGSHEIMLSYDFGKGKSQMVTSRFL
ncbi:MAG: type IX secretion system membrane protein PorP/SprF [Bacteroidetes bacterium]|nr:type IX secretion system membrane protein PorP/SprF [Bacteroidota bacterium]